jgi:uncharacterized protein YbbC (DUF1343 family)
MRLTAPLAACCAALCCAPSFAQTFTGATEVDAVINQAIHQDKLPGGVLLVDHADKVVYRKAYGYRSLVGAKEPMTVDTIFDLASLTKIVATTSAMMRLYEQGRLDLEAPVTRYLPEFQGGQSPITIRELMTHFSGFRPDIDINPPWSGYETGIRMAMMDKPVAPPNTKFIYSDTNFMLLGEIARRLSGKPENEYVADILFKPLGMKDTGYLPPASLRPRIAPTEMQPDGTVLRGVVHDPRARWMGGVAGHAGVFSTADDLAKFCRMILDGGSGIFSPATIQKFTSPASPPDNPVVRGLGWDINSPYSGTRGDLFPVGSFGHTGFTGTSIWIDPSSRTFVIFLANSVHPHPRPAITPLRRKIATIVAASFGYAPHASLTRETRTGFDVLAASGFADLKGKRVGLVTNQTGVDRLGRRNVDLMLKAGVNLVSLFSPEHGFLGVEDRTGIGNATDPSTGLKVWSLYGKTLRPTPEMLKGLDALVFDIQDVGVRFYTYETTMLYCMEEAAKAHIAFYVLDRPNPLSGDHVEGPMLEPDKFSFVGAYPLPLRHGLTMGELAALENGEKHLATDLHIIRMENWTRRMWFDETGLPWVNPSPNIRNLNEAILYPGIGMLEYSTNYSVGRGTDAPFEQIGAEWIDGPRLAAFLSARHLPGVSVQAVHFTPASSHLAGKPLSGIRFSVTDRDAFSSSQFGLELAAALASLYRGKIDFDVNRKLIGNSAVIAALDRSTDVFAAASQGIPEFLAIRAKYLLYN